MSGQSIVPPPLRERQRHRARPKKDGVPSSRWLARSFPPPPVAAEEPETEQLHEPRYLTPPPVAVDLHEPEIAADPFGSRPDADEDEDEPSVVEMPRRQKLVRIVSAATAVAALLCVAALVRGLAGASHTPTTALTAALSLPSDPAASLPAPAAASHEDAPAKTAAEIREEARGLLVNRKLDDAIVVAERATTMDPTDATAWLILGAAQMDSGRYAESTATFRSCVEHATVGPVDECRKFVK